MNTMKEITLQQVAVHYDDVPFMEDLNVSIKKGKVTTLVGPNGSGKSTMLKAIARLLKIKSGAILLDSTSIHSQPSKQLAKQLAILPQHTHAPEKMTVSDLVWLGRYPYQGLFKAKTIEDERAVHCALKRTDMVDLAHHELDQLSGGQQQRAWIAMALAQDTPYLLLDEPTTFLDMAHQLETLELLRHLNQHHDKTIVIVLHDVNLAARYSDELILMNEGKVVKQGSPKEVLIPKLLHDIFKIKVHILIDPETQAPYFIPYCCGC